MFTGIIEEMGTIQRISMQGNSGRITIQADKVLEGTKAGDRKNRRFRRDDHGIFRGIFVNRSEKYSI